MGRVAVTLSLLPCLVALASEEETAGRVEVEQVDRGAIVGEVFAAIHAQSLDFLETVYDDEVVFISPLGRVEGKAELKAWYENLYEKAEEISFEIAGEYVDGGTHAVEWVMTIQAGDLNRGEEVSVSGASVLKFDEADRVVYHRDYYDLGEFVYEHVGVLRWMVNRAKRRMTP